MTSMKRRAHASRSIMTSTPAERPARPSPLHELPMSHDPRTNRRLPAARRLPMLALPAALLACTSPIALAADANTADATTLDTIQVTAPIAKDPEIGRASCRDRVCQYV